MRVRNFLSLSPEYFGWYRILLLVILLSTGGVTFSQELYVYTEPASNMPAKALSLKYKGKFLGGLHSGRLEQRHMLNAGIGLSKKWMLYAGTTVSDMYTPGVRWESANLYLKYRFLSIDDIHKHFRAAAFLETSWSRNDPYYDEISFDGDQSGVRAGLVLTQLLHKLAVSTTLSVSEVLHEQRWDKNYGNALYPYEAFNYSLSAGYLIFPVKYSNFKQTNYNIYLEMLGSRALDKRLHYLDLAPAVQLIFNSTTKLNAGYRFQLTGNMHRMAEKSFMISLETTFLNTFKKKP